MVKIIWTGTRAELDEALAHLGKVLTGQEPDPTGLVEDMQLRLGATLLSRIKDAYVTKSEGGTDEMGISWPALSPATLALRRKVTGGKTLAKLKALLPTLP